MDHAARIRLDVERLAAKIGARNFEHYDALERAAAFVIESLRAAGYEPRIQRYEARGKAFANIEAEIHGTSSPDEIFVVGAHYDTRKESPGADDNASGTAALLALARLFSERRMRRTVRFVAFTNEERPFLHKKTMGSRVYAGSCRAAGDDVVGMASLECLGYRSGPRGRQRLSLFGALAPREGNFLAFVTNRASLPLTNEAIESFRTGTPVSTERYVLPTHFPGAWSSDHWSFWKEGFRAFMVTDTAWLRNPHYHRAGDTAEKLDYAFLASGVAGMQKVVERIAG